MGLHVFFSYSRADLCAVRLLRFSSHLPLPQRPASCKIPPDHLRVQAAAQQLPWVVRPEGDCCTDVGVGSLERLVQLVCAHINDFDLA